MKHILLMNVLNFKLFFFFFLTFIYTYTTCKLYMELIFDYILVTLGLMSAVKTKQKNPFYIMFLY